MADRRLDRIVRGRWPDEGDAADLIRAGRVRVGGLILTNPASRVRSGTPVELVTVARLRGEPKLEAALTSFAISVENRVALDVGAAAGGFTRVLLDHGARRVYAVDVGFGQLRGSLRQDPRVVNLENTNLGILDGNLVPDHVEVVTIDVSYLALGAAVGQLGRVVLHRGADLIGLVKPMFELRLATAPEDDARVERALRQAVASIGAAGWTVRGSMASPVRGARGAREWLVHAVWTP